MKLKIITLFICCFSLVTAWSQTMISGIVTDEAKIPLSGVNIIIKGSSTGAVTDFDGNFAIKAKSGSILNFSYLGFNDVELTVSSQVTLNITMKGNTSELDEIVVIGYGTQKKESILGAINQIKGEEILETGSSNITNALNGLTPGLNIVQNSGQPGDDSGDIFIRGNSNPLILVDGVEIVGGFSNIDPRDIESISTLKDGAATAVYGIRGANGVIIITTKRGKTGKPVVSFSSEFSVKLLPEGPNVLDAYTAQSALNVGVLNDQAYGSGYTSEADLTHWRDGDLPYMYPDVNWAETVTKDYATSFNQTVSLRGGNEFVKYYASAGYLQEGDIAKTEQLYEYDPKFKFSRYSFRANLDFSLTKTTKLKTSISSRLEDTNEPGNGNNLSSAFLALYTLAPGSVVPYYPASVMEQYPDPLYPGVAEGRFGAGPNTYAALNRAGSANSINNVFSIDFELEQELDFITKGLSFTGKYNYISNYQSKSGISYDGSLYSQQDTFTLKRDGTWDSSEGVDYERPLYYILGSESINNNQEISYKRAQLNYERSFGNHNVTGLALFSRNKRITNVSFPFFNEDYVGRFTYDYDTRYFFELSGSYNGDETFAEGHRFKFFPSAAVGINLAKENFVKNTFPVLNNFKLRYSYGETGSKAGIGNNRWQYISYFDYAVTAAERRLGSRFFFGEFIDDTLTILNQSQIGNTDLTWATVTKQNIGVDFGLFKSKISGLVEFFKENRDNLITRPSGDVSAMLGLDTQYPYANLDATESHGYEFSLTYKNKTQGGLNYSVTGFYGFNENRVIKSAADGPGTPEYTAVKGKPIGASSLLQADGYFQNIDEIVNYPIISGNPGLGDYRYIDYNANGTVIGSATEDQIRFDLPDAPRHSYSFMLGASYKGWSISALINGIKGHKGLINADLAYALPSGAASGRYVQLDYWTPTNTNAKYPALHALTDPNVSANTARVISLDYIKLRSMNVGYNFDMSNNKTISDLKIYINGNNLFTISDIDYGDPEGNTPGAYPLLRRVNLGLNLSF
ncbi:SusC/RagA family TonB-linked outer membrane protein [Mariniflexile ostreae]|uniref:SusC/RagA family TonB-linked outer membrane protein n=1 Tax=Mariniflexile ostreae TaxID=1520892 RepID=A0ABV5FEH5_9FLAO